MDHDSVVAECPAGAAFDLVADEAVLEAEAVVSVGGFVEEVSELASPFGIFGILDSEKAVFNGEGIVFVLAEGFAGDFWGPVGEIFAVEEGFVVGIFWDCAEGCEGGER